jgi:hypothetical protein
MADKTITDQYVADLCRRIAEGEAPRKEISLKEFIRQMLPHVKDFLARNYEYKEIAEFLGHVSAADLKKAVAKDAAETRLQKSEKD